ncbi:hypothetical protein SeLEV6574_g04012 [Synchytrium endobioticum]|uniref:Uncharacterized protein n=1 Tax=Synchytrium endobioticum TaxID=286115 RepID=A0A507D1G5_9FUNG|nr:hypothetical protein SeLEV6574_g04012 [Synchytrium endobioticum]
MPSSRADANMSPDAISHNQSGDASDSVASIFAHPQRAAGPATATDGDPIIRQLLANRARMTDGSDAHEDERQRRMYNMQRHSHQYRRLQVRDANAKWGDDLAALDAALAPEQQPIATPTHPAPLAVPLPAKRDRRVTFCVDPAHVISLPSIPSLSDSECSSWASVGNDAHEPVRAVPVLPPAISSTRSDAGVQEGRRGKRRSSGTGPAWRVIKMLGWALVAGGQSVMAGPMVGL